MSNSRGYNLILWHGGPGLCFPAGFGGQSAFGYARVGTHEDTNTIADEAARCYGWICRSPLPSIRLNPGIRPCSSLTEGFGPGDCPQCVCLGQRRRPSPCLSSTQVIKPEWAPTRQRRRGPTHAHQVPAGISSSWRASIGRTGTRPRDEWPDADEIGPDFCPGWREQACAHPRPSKVDHGVGQDEATNRHYHMLKYLHLIRR
ncbi:hypothetical protein KVT40_006274 [Elsinoe batatas]|uniref:Uncharacterized protein n=1 Tax=Elsinoe batatas TaxID=2601811 RepID=A0A8K0PG12_9PEZI|nr:hypothetical protein KVT40_006274 [Elsinoe batatas]